MMVKGGGGGGGKPQLPGLVEGKMHANAIYRYWEHQEIKY